MILVKKSGRPIPEGLVGPSSSGSNHTFRLSLFVIRRKLRPVLGGVPSNTLKNITSCLAMVDRQNQAANTGRHTFSGLAGPSNPRGVGYDNRELIGLPL